jgi:hypothetical protein
VAEYKELINGLRIAIELGIRRLEVRSDSRLVFDQVMKESSCLSPKMAAYCQEVRQLEDKFDGLELNHIPRQLNEAANTLVKMASSRQPVPSIIFASDQYKPSILYEGSERARDKPVAELSKLFWFKRTRHCLSRRQNLSALQTEQLIGLSGLRPIQPRLDRIDVGLPRTKASPVLQ